MLVFRVPVPAGRIRLPNLNQSVRDRPPVAVEDSSADNDALAEWFAGMLDGQVVVVFPNSLMTVNGSRDL
jgi:hypothetical protein